MQRLIATFNLHPVGVSLFSVAGCKGPPTAPAIPLDREEVTFIYCLLTDGVDPLCLFEYSLATPLPHA